MSTETQTAPIVEIPSEPILMWRDQQAIDKYYAAAKAVAEKMSNALAFYRELEQGELTLSELSDLFHNRGTVDNFVREKITGNQPKKIGGLTFSAEKVKEMVEVPELGRVERAIEGLKKAAIDSQAPMKGGYYMRFEDFEEISGEVIFKEEALEKYIASNSHYAETEADKEIFLVLQDMASKAEALGNKYRLHLFPTHSGTIKFPVLQNSGFGYEGVKTTFDAKSIKRTLDQHFGRTRY